MLAPGPHNCMTMGLHACLYCASMHFQSDVDQHNITHCLNGEADDSSLVSMHVYMHLAFKELMWCRLSIFQRC